MEMLKKNEGNLVKITEKVNELIEVSLILNDKFLENYHQTVCTLLNTKEVLNKLTKDVEDVMKVMKELQKVILLDNTKKDSSTSKSSKKVVKPTEE